MLKSLKLLNPRKGAGPDKIIPKVLKTCATGLSYVITKLYSRSIETQTTPTIWKTATIKPLPKVNNPDQLKQYRPIALTSCLVKILERLMKTYISNHTPLDKFQFAYRSHRSTQDAVLCLTTTVTNFIDKQACNYSRCLFLDFSSAFNTINVSHLIPKLQHLDCNVTGWIASFLSGRVQRTLVDGTMSQPIITNTGTPQGSVLSPLLFSVYTDGIRSQTSNVTILKYADDTCVIGCISDESDLSNYFSEVNRISNQCNSLDLLLNPSKTQEMLFSTKRIKPDTPAMILNDVSISFSDNVKYLGVQIDDKLRFEEHINSVATKASQRMYIVRNFVYLSSTTLASMLFKSFIISLLTYCLPILYTSLYAKDKKQLRHFFKEALKLGIKDLGDIDNLIDNRTKTLLLQYIHDDNHFLNNFLEKCPSGRYRTIKYRSTWGRDSFLRQAALKLNKFI